MYGFRLFQYLPSLLCTSRNKENYKENTLIIYSPVISAPSAICRIADSQSFWKKKLQDLIRAVRSASLVSFGWRPEIGSYYCFVQKCFCISLCKKWDSCREQIAQKLVPLVLEHFQERHSTASLNSQPWTTLTIKKKKQIVVMNYNLPCSNLFAFLFRDKVSFVTEGKVINVQIITIKREIKLQNGNDPKITI